MSALVLRLVRRVEAVQHAGHDRGEDARGQRLVALAERAREPGDRLAGHVLHDEEQLAARRDDVERRDDVGMADARGEASLVEEHRDELGVRRELRVEPLDRDRSREADRTEQASKMDRCHTPCGDGSVEGVPPYDSDLLGGVAHAPIIVAAALPGGRQRSKGAHHAH